MLLSCVTMPPSQRGCVFCYQNCCLNSEHFPVSAGSPTSSFESRATRTKFRQYRKQLLRHRYELERSACVASDTDHVFGVRFPLIFFLLSMLSYCPCFPAVHAGDSCLLHTHRCAWQSQTVLIRRWPAGAWSKRWAPPRYHQTSRCHRLAAFPAVCAVAGCSVHVRTCGL